MKELALQKVEHEYKSGDHCPGRTPNVKEDCLLIGEDGTPIGFFMRKAPENILQLMAIANAEFNSERVPKQEMSRGPQGSKKDKAERAASGKRIVEQYSTIIGSVPPQPVMRRPYPNRSSVHREDKAKTFIKAMLKAAKESEKLIKEVTPGLYEAQQKAISNTPEKWRFANLFTSSISNYNIAADFHQDKKNLTDTVNVIITKRKNSKGGNLYVPDYDACFDQCDGSVLVYPAWRNLHGVTPIQPTYKGGYRNSFVFYPLAAFEKE